MGKKKSTLSQDRMGHQTVANYYPVVQHRMEDKNQKKLLENEETIVFSDETNDNSNDSSNNHLNRTEEATTTKAYTGPAEETKKDSKDEGEDEGEDKNEAENNQGTNGTDGFDAKNKNDNSNTDNQESYFNTETEEATTMGADTEAINVESVLQKHAERLHANGAAVVRRMEEVENMPAQSTNVVAIDTVNEQKSKIDDGWDDDDILVDEDEIGGEGKV